MLYMADAYMGKAHVTADQIGDYNAGVSGSGCVLNVGEQLRAEIINANLVRIYDGAFIFQGYRRSGITAGSYEDITIENGTQAQKRNDLICAKYEKDAATSKENLTLVVIKGTPGDTASDPDIPEGDVRSGSAVCYMPLYRVKLDGINLTAVEKIFTVRKTLEEIESDVTALNSQILNNLGNIRLNASGANGSVNINNYTNMQMYIIKVRIGTDYHEIIHIGDTDHAIQHYIVYGNGNITYFWIQITSGGTVKLVQAWNTASGWVGPGLDYAFNIYQVTGIVSK